MMKRITLREYVEEQRLTDISDTEIIKIFIVENDLEEWGMDLLQELIQNKMMKLKREIGFAKTWINMIPAKHLYEEYGIEIGDKLHTLELDFVANGGNRLSPAYFEWAKENVPNIKEPVIYFRPLIEYLKECEICFMR